MDVGAAPGSQTCMLQELKGKGKVVSVDLKKDAEASNVFCKLEACKQAKIVLCVLLEEWRAVLGKIAKDSNLRKNPKEI